MSKTNQEKILVFALKYRLLFKSRKGKLWKFESMRYSSQKLHKNKVCSNTLFLHFKQYLNTDFKSISHKKDNLPTESGTN